MKKILPYEEELLENLRSELYMGVPVSLIVLCFEICNTNCYPTAINLTRGMDHFKLIYGDINIYSKQEYPNHSWVEKDGYVYDPTDGFKYERDFYYNLYKPQITKVYDEKTCQEYDFYRDVLNEKGNMNLDFLTIMLQYIEEQENINPTINHTLLLNEINTLRKDYNITLKIDKNIMEKYREKLDSKKI